MTNTATIRPLTSQELSAVCGGYDEIIVTPFKDTFLVEQFELFRLGLPSVFGTNPDSQIVEAPLAP